MKSFVIIFASLSLIITGCRKDSMPSDTADQGNRMQAPTSEELEAIKANLRNVARDMTVVGKIVDESGHPVSKALVRYVIESTADLEVTKLSHATSQRKESNTTETGEDGIFKLSAQGVFGFAIRSVTKEGYTLFRDQPLPIWRVPEAAGAAVEDHSDEPILLLGDSFTRNWIGAEKDLHLDIGAARLHIPMENGQEGSTVKMGLKVERVATGSPDHSDLSLSFDLEGGELRSLRLTGGGETFNRIQRMLLDAFGSPTGPWKGGPPGGPLFLGRTNEGAVGILRITPVSIDGSKTLEVSVQGWLRPDLLAKSTLQTLAGSDQTPKSQSNLTEAAAPTKAPPTAKSSQATPIPPPVPGSYSVIVELADAKLIFTSADALKFTRPGEADAKSPPLEAARNPGRLITLQIAAAAGPSASLIAFPFPVQQQPSNLFEITPTDGAMVSVEESDNREFGWIASRLLTSDGKSLLPLPRFPKKFYRITLRPVSATKDSKSAP